MFLHAYGRRRQDIGKYGLIENSAAVDDNITKFSNALRTGAEVIQEEIQVRRGARARVRASVAPARPPRPCALSVFFRV